MVDDVIDFASQLITSILFPDVTRSPSGASVATPLASSAALYEMRRTPPQNKVSVEKPGSPRLTLRLHPVKGRDEKKAASQKSADTAAACEGRLQYSVTMENSRDGGKPDDVYEFKNSKEGTSTTPATQGPSPKPETDNSSGGEAKKDVPVSSQDKKSESVPKEEKKEGETVSGVKRSNTEANEGEDIDEETKRKKRKEDCGKEVPRNGGANGSGRGVNRNGASSEKGTKNGSASKNLSASICNKSANICNKSSVSSGPVSVSNAPSESRKGTNAPGSAGSSPKSVGGGKTGTGDSESDAEDGRKSADSGAGGLKVPPLKIVIPQQSSSEQEQGNRNGKNGTQRPPALPYVVTSTNESDRDSASGSGGEGKDSGSGGRADDRKDGSSSWGNEPERSSQRVTRSSHRIATLHTTPGGQPSTSAESPGEATVPAPVIKQEEKVEEQQQQQQHPVDVHPRKRKIKPKEETPENSSSTATTSSHPHDQPVMNCYEVFLNIRRQIDRRRKNLFPVQPKPPQGFKDYLMNRCTYVLAGNASARLSVPTLSPPQSLSGAMKDLFAEQEKERYRLRMQHVIEKEKLVLSVEQEILRVHGRAARALANQSLPFSVCTILRDEEVYNVMTPEQEEKDRNARSRYNGRLFLSWLQDVDDKWEKIKEFMLLRHHNEAESLHAVQRMDWEWKMKELGLCETKTSPVVDELHVPMVHVSDDFDLLPA